MFELNAQQVAMLALVEHTRKSAFERARSAAFAAADLKINGDVDERYAMGLISREQATALTVKPLPEEIDMAFKHVETTIEMLRDFQTVGFHLPQRTGATLFGQWLIDDFLKKNPEAHALYIGPHEPDMIDCAKINCDAFICPDSSTYGRLCRILERAGTNRVQTLDEPIVLEHKKAYSLIVFDNCNYIRGRDVRFEQLLRVIHHPTIKPLQLLVHFSS